PVQLPLGEAVRDAATSQSGGQELRTRHDAVLPSGDPANRPVTGFVAVHNARLGAGRSIRRELCIVSVHNWRPCARAIASFVLPTSRLRPPRATTEAEWRRSRRWASLALG